MPYTFDVVAWEGWDQRRHGGPPPTPQQAKGLKVLVTNTDNPNDTDQFWAFTITRFQDFSEWWVYIGSLVTMYGLELADEPPDFEAPEPPDEDYDEDEEEEEEEPEEKPSIVQRIGRALGRLFRR